jgi:RHS repeat-associated protein
MEYMPYGESLVEEHQNSINTPYKFNGKELDDETGNYYYGARYYNPKFSFWLSVDPLVETTMQPYSAFNNNPVFYTDPTGMIAEPIYDEEGKHLGNTKEGFTGQVLIYSGDKDVDFSEMSADEAIAMEGVDTYDNQRGSLTGDAKSNVWTHIASQMEGQQIYDETFSMSDLEGGKIHYDGKARGSWVSSYALGKGNGKIRGSDNYSYETTVENIQSSIGVHEYYSHIKKNQGDRYDSHRLAYKNVINYKSLWNNTTDAYKGFNMRTLLRYTKSETGRTKVDPLYRNLYKNYKDKR